MTFADRIGNAQRGSGPLHLTGMFPGSATREEWITGNPEVDYEVMDTHPRQLSIAESQPNGSVADAELLGDLPNACSRMVALPGIEPGFED